jgi:hypothetical protein
MGPYGSDLRFVAWACIIAVIGLLLCMVIERWLER